jgi:predicted RNA-binding Zn ribbon-like protein
MVSRRVQPLIRYDGVVGRDNPPAPPDLRVVEEFLNTIDERTFSRHGVRHHGGEVLTTPTALSNWLAGQGLIAQATKASPDDLVQAIALRDGLRTAMTLTPGTPPQQPTLRHINVLLAEFPLRIEFGVDGSPRLDTATTGVRGALGAIIASVAHATARGTWSRLRICAALDCRWAFYDNSRNGARRWCSMTVCGNRDKTRRYRDRLR